MRTEERREGSRVSLVPHTMQSQQVLACNQIITSVHGGGEEKKEGWVKSAVVWHACVQDRRELGMFTVFYSLTSLVAGTVWLRVATEIVLRLMGK